MQGKPTPQQLFASGAENPFRIFANKRFALYFLGQLVSQAGTWMQMVALSWLTYSLTKSAFLLAVITACGQLPSLFLMPFAGVVADRFNRHKIILLTQTAAMLQAAVLAFLTFSHEIAVWNLILLGTFLGMVNAFDMPTRSAFVVNLVEKKEDLPAAIAMNSTLVNVSRLLGPALAGWIVSTRGEGLCFLLNALSYLAVIVALLFIKGDFTPSSLESRKHPIEELKDGLKYIFTTSPLSAIILFMASFGLFAMSYATLLPVFVKQIGGNASTLGNLMSFSALGSVCGTVLLATRKSVHGLGKLLTISSFIFSGLLIFFSTVNSFWVAAGAMVLVGCTMMLQLGSSHTILQAVVEDSKRGRVMSFFTMAFIGTAPIGGLVAGWLANKFGFSLVVLGCGVACLSTALIFSMSLSGLKEKAKPITIVESLPIPEKGADAVT